MVSYPVVPLFKVRSLSPGGPASSTRRSVSCIILPELKPTGKIVKIKLQFSHSCRNLDRKRLDRKSLDLDAQNPGKKLRPQSGKILTQFFISNISIIICLFTLIEYLKIFIFFNLFHQNSLFIIPDF